MFDAGIISCKDYNTHKSQLQISRATGTERLFSLPEQVSGRRQAAEEKTTEPSHLASRGLMGWIRDPLGPDLSTGANSGSGLGLAIFKEEKKRKA